MRADEEAATREQEDDLQMSLTFANRSGHKISEERQQE